MADRACAGESTLRGRGSLAEEQKRDSAFTNVIQADLKRGEGPF